ncbi:hypothetical protein BO71DRAFT_93392 [Aspergillus ellipticus CBS 707.79]|uniref:Uncharacterized protein n=1 Tax=Aspergillus ellipticus CBS 707.79 TaxID=1448320 RepID=A0A319D623_9EURO|nr:hypothetical protein BO71DRAFT_93392 [Aspergillus ellipticus CBS 707.79]
MNWHPMHACMNHYLHPRGCSVPTRDGGLQCHLHLCVSLRLICISLSAVFCSFHPIAVPTTDAATLEAQFAQERAAYESIIQGTDLHSYFGNRVLESRTTAGRLVAVRVKPRVAFRRSEAAMVQYASENYAGLLRGGDDRQQSGAGPAPGPGVAHPEQVPEGSRTASNSSGRSKRCGKYTQPYLGRIGRQKTYNFFDRLQNNDMGPFDSEGEFDEWFLGRVSSPLAQAFWKRRLPKMRSKCPRFVLAHGDLAARNILVHGAFATGGFSFLSLCMIFGGLKAPAAY